MEDRPLLVHRNENLLYGLCLITSLFVVIYLAATIIGLFILVILASFSLFAHIFSMAHIQINGVRLQNNQFPDLYQKVVNLSEKIELKQIPEVYIVESGGMLNAFATKVLGYFGKNMVVLYSDFVDIAAESDQFDIDFAIAHELAHLKRKHIIKSLFILPAMYIPFIGTSYSRLAEYTCDRMAAYYTGNGQNAIQGLLVFASGRRLFKQVNIEAYMNQYNDKKGILVTIAELLSTHPPIPKRIQEIEVLTKGEATVQLVNRKKATIAIFVLVFLLVPALFAGAVFLGVSTLGDYNLFADFENDDYTPLMEAAMNGDTKKVESLLAAGADPNQLTNYGESALSIAIDYENTELVPLLLENGADPNLIDQYGLTPLYSAVVMDNLSSAKLLLDAGANPMIVDEEGMTAIDYAKEFELPEMIDLLKKYKE
ncbi:M48 family metallopeptidase [Aquibacillus salsiterrae]|uniref:M48 family metallopeptidase n=1 Tax=Aquibacillus salsiterrae TaxID=2950439 RepID=A0A9X4AFK3_9BACI|nr:M48 family metallopeptidase [Aquibacillus salsiterrae]MDC3418001.1 M48 family metallopeptidase [Aquibacillus salsiterrae]